MTDQSRKLATLYSKYRNPSSRIFLENDVNHLLAHAKQDPDLQPITRGDIVKFKDLLTTHSRNKERRILRGRKRHLSFRKWKCYGPNNILLGDLAFLRDIRSRSAKKYTIAVFIDAFRCRSKSVRPSVYGRMWKW